MKFKKIGPPGPKKGIPFQREGLPNRDYLGSITPTRIWAFLAFFRGPGGGGTFFFTLGLRGDSPSPFPLFFPLPLPPVVFVWGFGGRNFFSYFSPHFGSSDKKGGAKKGEFVLGF